MVWTGLIFNWFYLFVTYEHSALNTLFLLKSEQQDQSSGHHAESCTSCVWPTIFMFNTFKRTHAFILKSKYDNCIYIRVSYIIYINYIYSNNCTRLASGLWKGLNFHPALLCFMHFQTSIIHLLHMTSVIHPTWM